MSALDTVTGSFGDFTEDFTSGGYDSDFNYGAPGGGDVGVILNPDGTPSGGSGIGAVTGTSGSGSGSGVGNALTRGLNSFLTGPNAAGNIMGLLTFLKGMGGGGGGGGAKTRPINPDKYTFNQKQIAQPAVMYVPYSGSAAPVMGRKNFEDPTYTVKAAEGGIMGLARGGSAKRPRYLQGATDGMADKLSTNIDGKQAAALSHGEFVVPADVVSHLGNGNSEAGAKQLYKMMDRIRLARTGNKKQGKRINPEKFTPGGLAGGIAGYAGGGVVAFTAGGATGTGTGTTTVESNLSPWAASGITRYIEQGTALANQPYQAYQGPLTAGTSPLQTKAFNTAANLSVPANITKAGTAIDTAGNAMGALKYTPTATTNQFSTPGAYQTGVFGNMYTGTGAYNPTTATNQYSGTSPYTASNIGIDQFNTANMQQYMNPYLQMSLDPQIAEARRQADITQMGNASKLAQAGAYGGSRGALMQSEAQRNLGANLSNITGQGYNTAYNTALNAFNAQQGLGLQAQQANEASRQFGANQALSNAQNRAQYGQAAQAQNAQQQQFGANQALSNAQNAAQYGLAGLNAAEASRQFGANQAMTAAQQQAQYGQAAQQLNAQQQQFGANYGLSGLEGQLKAGTALGGLGMQEGQLGLANLNAMSTLGGTQRDIEQQGIDALYKQYEQERLDPYKQIQFQQSLYTGLPIDTANKGYSMTDMEKIMQALGLGTAVRDTLAPAPATTTP